jgi:hypothetical protein
MGAPVGNTNASKKNRLLTDSLRRELTQNPSDVLAITRKLIEAAKSGEAWAQALIHDRSDGKVPQPVVGDADEDPIQVEGRIKLVKPEGGE